MAVPSVTFDGTRVNASDTNTNWGNFGSGGGAPASEAQIAYQGTAVNTKHNGTALDGIDYDPGSGAINMTTAGNKLWFAKCIVADGADVNATKGAVLYCGSASNAYDGWVVAGTGEVSNTGIFAEYPAQLGYIITAINPAITAWHDSALGVGTPSYTAVDWFGFQAAMVVGGAKGENVALDAIDVGRGLNLVGGDGASDDAVFADFVDADQGGTRWGVVFAKFGIVYAQGLLVIGRNASGTVVHTDFTDPDAVVVFPDAYIDEGDFGVEFDITNASSVMEFGGTIIGRGALVSGNDTRPDLIVTGTGGTLDLSCKLQNFRNITLNSATTVAGGVFEFLDMTQGTAEITNSTLRTTSAADAASIDDATFGTSSGIHDTEFIQGGLGHAVQITGATQTITLTNVTWTGYGANNTSSSAIEFTGTGPHTVNVIGGTAPTIQDNGETVNVVSNPVTAKITTTTTANIPIEGARVLLLAANGTGDLPYKVDAADYSITSTVVTVNVSSHPFDTGQKVLIEADPQDVINGVHTITGTTATTFTFTVAGAPNTASEDCSYTGVVLEGVTDVNGEISDTRSYSLNQPVTGRARKGTVAPYFKNAPINGTINASTGFDVSVPMIPDGGILVAVAPSAPGSVTATAQDGSADLAWATPFNGGSPITDYLIDYQTVPAGGWTLFADGTNTSAFTTVTGLTNGTEYEFRVAAVNDIGTSDESPTSNAVTIGVPNEPTGLAATPGDTEVDLSWTAPNDTNGSAITDYRVEYLPSGGSWTLFADGVSTAVAATVTGLTNGVSYQFRVAGINARGTGPFSTTASATPLVAGPVPTVEMLYVGKDPIEQFEDATMVAVLEGLSGVTVNSTYHDVSNALPSLAPYDFMFISAAVSSPEAESHMTAAIPILHGEADAWDGSVQDYHTAGGAGNSGNATFRVSTGADVHPIISALGWADNDTKIISSDNLNGRYVNAADLRAGVDRLMESSDASTEITLFAVSEGADLNGTPASDKRAGFGLLETEYDTITADGEALLAQMILWLTGPTSAISDNFNRADEADIAGWTEIVDATETVEIVSNAIQFDGTNVAAINDRELDGDVQWAEALVAGQSGSTGWREWGVGVRMLTDASDRSGYMVFAGPATSTSAEITKIELNRIATNGTRTTLDTVLDVPDLIGKRIGISIDASGNMKAYIDGLEVTNLAATDTTHAAGATRRKAGVWGYNASDTHTVDDFEAGTGAFSSGGYSDSFTYADATNLNAQSAWTAATGGSITTESNEVLIGSESAVQATYSTALSGDLTNVYAQVDVTAIAGTGSAKSVNVEVRRLTDNTSSTDRMAYFRYEHNTGDWVLKYRDSGNAEQTVTTTGGTAPTAPYTARLEARGELYIGYADGVEVVRGTISEAALPHTHTYTGFHTFQATNTTIDNFECGTLEPDVLFTSIDYVNGTYASPQQTVSGNSAFTPTNGSLLVVVAKATCDNHTTAHSWAISDTQGLTWTQRSITGTIFDSPNYGMQAVCWTAPVVTGASTLITVDAFDGSAVNGIYGFRIIEVNAHDAASPIVQSANNIDLTADPLTVTLGSTPAAGNVLTAWLGDMDGSGSWDAPMTGFASFGTVDNNGDSPSCLRESTTSTATAITQGQSFTASYYGSAGFAIEFNPLS